jgi:hypothetical protein
MMRGADIVTVPDFQGSNSALFEARTLLFLGSWLENAGSSSDWPLHLACIGEPPESVRRLAERCSAHASVHEPVAGGSVPVRNKLRGFDVQPRTGRLLLLDTDVVILGDPRDALDLGPGLAVARAANHRVGLDSWERVYRALGEDMPEERVRCQRALVAERIPELALHGEHHLKPMHPYFNTGVVCLPWERASEFREQWENYLDRLAELFPPAEEGNRTVSGCDQMGFALALLRMRTAGLLVRELPNPLHANWILLLAESVGVDETAIYHAVHLYRQGNPERRDWLREVDLYEDFILGHVYPPSFSGQLLQGWHYLAGEPTGVAGIRTLCTRIRQLTERYVTPAASSHAFS